jgi:hypothetical protein
MLNVLQEPSLKTLTGSARGENGLTNRISKADPILGLSDRQTVMLDFDDVSFKLVLYWAMFALEKFKLRGFIILKSSKNHYHVVFDRYAESWDENLSIIAWVAIVSKSVTMLRYLAMQCIKMSSTLRVAPKGDKASPRIVPKYGRYGSQDYAIKDFLEYRQLIKCARKFTKQKTVKHARFWES